MSNPALALTPSLGPDRHHAAAGRLGRLLPWLRERFRFAVALHRLRRIESRELDELNIARADLPTLAWRHARGLSPLDRAQGQG